MVVDLLSRLKRVTVRTGERRLLPIVAGGNHMIRRLREPASYPVRKTASSRRIRQNYSRQQQLVTVIQNLKHFLFRPGR